MRQERKPENEKEMNAAKYGKDNGKTSTLKSRLMKVHR